MGKSAAFQKIQEKISITQEKISITQEKNSITHGKNSRFRQIQKRGLPKMRPKKRLT